MQRLGKLAVSAAFAVTATMAVQLSAQSSTETEKTETKTTTTTTTVITETVTTSEKEKTEWKPFKVCVLDFNMIDIEGQKRFLDEKNNPIDVPPQCTLNDADRKSVNSVMQGFVRMIDAWDNTKTNTANRGAQVDDNVFTRQKALDLFRTVVKGEPRPMVIGAEYLSAYLGRNGEVFGCMDSSTVVAAMEKLQKEPDFPQDFMLRLAKETGATHLIYGTVSDLSRKSNSFSGYGIQTNTTTYQLDVLVKMIDLAAQHSVYSNVYTGTYREQRPISTEQFDSNIFQTLMKSALEQAAADLYDVCKPGRKNKITVTPMPYLITVNPTGGMFFKASEAEIYADGVRVANGGEQFPLGEGKHKLEIKASGYKTKTLDLDVKADQAISAKLEK